MSSCSTTPRARSSASKPVRTDPVAAVLTSPNRIVALALGVGFAGFGLVALVTGRPLLGALFVGAAVLLLVTGWRGITPARIANIAAGTTWLALGYAGLFLVGSGVDPFGLTALDEVVLFAAAVVHLAVGLGARRDRDPVTP